MKRFLKIAISLALVLTSVLCLASCSFVNKLLGKDDGDYAANYKKIEISDANTAPILTAIESNVMADEENLKYVATYKYEMENKLEGYEYTKKYDVLMKVNQAAAVGEVFAYIELTTNYTQPDGRFTIDNLTTKFCIVRMSEGENYTDYKVYAQVGDVALEATYEEMIQLVEEKDGYVYDKSVMPMVTAVIGEYGSSGYFDLLLEYASLGSEKDIVSGAIDNPLIYCMHYYYKNEFVSLVSELKADTNTQKYELYSADNMYKIVSEYSDKKESFVEEKDGVSYFKLNEDGTYAHKYVGSYKIENPAKNLASTTEKELKPLTEAIALPEWAK